MTSSLKEELLRPGAYAPLCPAAIELVETHISWVFLLERDVFKVKKPVDLGFLDFRTLEQRKDACDAEVRLNGRLAPAVYLGVVGIVRRADGALGVGAEGTLVEWAVHMRRLPDEHRADHLLARGELSMAAIELVASRLAAFHGEARSDEETARFGSPDAILENVSENFAQTRATAEHYIRAAELEELKAWQTSFLRDHAPMFARRIEEGRVRDGHGDLRLEHVYLEPGQPPAIIDCIEFNERFRYADVCADLAFLSMDLAAHDRVDLAERLLACYARETNDFDLFAIVDFYESYRAYVRAKIAAMLAEDAEVDHTVRRRAGEEARRHFLLACSFERRPLVPPVLVAVGGTIASGKSTVAEQLGGRMAAPVIETDLTRKSILGVQPEHPVHEGVWQGAYGPGMTEKVYREVFRRAGIVLRSGRPAIVAASFRTRASREEARALAASSGVPLLFVECRADPATCRARLRERERRASVSDGRTAVFDAFTATYEPVVELAESEHLVLDTTRRLEENLVALEKRIATWPAAPAKHD